MSEKADFFVNNQLKKDIQVFRKLADGSRDLDTLISNGNKERIPLPDTEVSLVINAPEGNGTDAKACHLTIRSDVDLNVSYSRRHSNWTIKILPNDLRSEAPTTVNVNIGEEGP